MDRCAECAKWMTGCALRLGELIAEQTLDELIAYCPDYAEGYNQRAFAEYLRFNYSAAIPLTGPRCHCAIWAADGQR